MVVKSSSYDAERILPDLISDVVDDTNEIFDLLKKEGEYHG